MTEVYELHKQATNSIVFFNGSPSFEALRISATGLTVNPDLTVDETAKAVLDAIDKNIKLLVKTAIDKERKACRDAVEKARAYNIVWYPKGYTISANSINEFYQHQHTKCLEAIDGR
jgi:hypothetical protein